MFALINRKESNVDLKKGIFYASVIHIFLFSLFKVVFFNAPLEPPLLEPLVVEVEIQSAPVKSPLSGQIVHFPFQTTVPAPSLPQLNPSHFESPLIWEEPDFSEIEKRWVQFNWEELY